MGCQKKALSLMMLLSVLSLSAASQAELHPELLVTTSGVDASYTCIPNRATVATGISWYINNTLLSDLQLNDVLVGMDNGTRIGTLTFRNVRTEYNNTRVQCLAITNNPDEMRSSTSMLIIPGPLSAVESLNASANNTTLFTHWMAPSYIVNFTYVDSSITYCVDVINSSTMLHSVCGITETEFTYPLPPRSWCEAITVTVTPVNVMGNGTRRSVQFSSARPNPEVINISTSSRPTYRLIMSVPICNARITIVDIDTEEQIILEGTSLMIQGTVVVFITEQLEEGHRYTVIVEAFNTAGRYVSETILNRGRGIPTTESTTAEPSNLETRVSITISVAIFVITLCTLFVVIVILVVKYRKKDIYVRVAGIERGRTCRIHVYEGTPFSIRRQINTDFLQDDQANIIEGMPDTFCQTQGITQPPKYTPYEYDEDILKALEEGKKLSEETDA